MKSNHAKSKRITAAPSLAGLALLCMLQCGPTGTDGAGNPGDSSGLNASPGENAPALNADGFAPIMSAVLPGGNPERQQAFARVDATSLMVRAKPRRDAQAMHRLDSQEAVEVLEESGDAQTIDGVTGRWAKIRALLVKGDRPEFLTGWVFGGYLTKGSDGEYQQAPAGGEYTAVWKMRPADYPFDPRGKSFSYGVACSGATFSEYGLEMDIHPGPGADAKPISGAISVSSSNAIIHDSESPSGNVCSTIERAIYRGTYSIKDGVIRVHFTKREDESERFGEDEPDDCAKIERGEAKVDLKDEYRIAYCYQRGATVPGVIGTIPGDDADGNPTFWAFISGSQ